MSTHRVHLDELRVAQTWLREVTPVWHDRFARLLWRHLPRLERARVLYVHPGAGDGGSELIRQLPEDCEIVVLAPSDLGRIGLHPAPVQGWGDRVSLAEGPLRGFVDRVGRPFDLVVANLVLPTALDMPEVLRELAVLAGPSGTILATLPMAGTWGEAEDLLRGVLRDMNKSGVSSRLRDAMRLRPNGAELAHVVDGLGLGPAGYVIEQERYTLLFRNGREFLTSPLVEFQLRQTWLAAIRGEAHDVFARLEAAIDAWDGSVFPVTIVAGIVVLQRGALGRGVHQTYWTEFPELDRLFGRAEAESAAVRAEGVALDRLLGQVLESDD